MALQAIGATGTDAVLSADEGRALFERASLRLLGIGAEEFLRRWDAGEYRDLPERVSVRFAVTVYVTGKSGRGVYLTGAASGRPAWTVGSNWCVRRTCRSPNRRRWGSLLGRTSPRPDLCDRLACATVGRGACPRSHLPSPETKGDHRQSEHDDRHPRSERWDTDTGDNEGRQIQHGEPLDLPNRPEIDDGVRVEDGVDQQEHGRQPERQTERAATGSRQVRHRDGEVP
jgi:hypothetical protein